MKKYYTKNLIISTFIIFVITSFKAVSPETLKIKKGSKISMIGGNLGSRMINYDHFETELTLRYPDNQLIFRNMCDPGDTPGFRPRSSRFSPWAFPGAEKFQTEYANNSGSEGHFESPDEWLSRLKSDVIIAFFGNSESFQGKAKLENFKAELNAFIKHSKDQDYNGQGTTQLAIVSPIAFEDLSTTIDLPNGKKENENLLAYTLGMKAICIQNKVLFIDAFTTSNKWYSENKEPLTIDGSQLNDTGYKIFAKFLADQVFGSKAPQSIGQLPKVKQAVDEKNWVWHNDYKVPNGVHVYGRRYNPFGVENYPAEIEKIRQMTSIRDSAIWFAAAGKVFDIEKADLKTQKLTEIKTNFNPDQNGSLNYLSGNEALDKLKMAPGYKIELFASETEFPDLAKPVQMTFDNKGRLWVVCMPSYPHYKPGDTKPNDKIIILEDTNNDGKADKQTIFAQDLHVPVGVEITEDGVFVSQGTNLVLLKDTDGDDKADKMDIIMSGFDDHDTHHEISAFVSDPSGAIYMGEGVFLHTNVETPYGTVRATNGGFFRYDYKKHHLERVSQVAIPNPWGIAFDHWGQNFFAETSSPDVRWMMPASGLPRYGEANPKSKQLIEKDHMVRPTSGLEFVSSRHFPDEVQGDMLLNNTIGFLGMKQHKITDDGTGYVTKHRQDLVVSSDRNFRPVDMEFAPDGSLYFIDWHNILIGHMQHNARDPLRDHTHGRVYRVTYPSRPLVTPSKVAGESIEALLEELKLPEFRTRYRVRRELRGRDAAEVLPKIKNWVAGLDKNDTQYEHHLLEALWVTWGLDKVDQTLLRNLLKAKDYHARAAAVKVLRYVGHQVADQPNLLMQAVKDANSRVRLEALVAASWLPKEKANPILAEAKKKPLDDWMKETHDAAVAHVNGQPVKKEKEEYSTTNIKGKDLVLFQKGREIYAKDGYCMTCHQADGKGLPASGFPPIAGSSWATGSEERLIKLVLKGMMGPIEVNGVKYPGQVPMTQFGGLLNDTETASVLTYIRNSFGNKASVIYPEKVKAVRAAIKSKKDFYQADKLLEEHPLEK